MSITIPPHFPDWLTRWVIGHFPVGNPDAMRAAADAWARSAERLTITLRDLERLARDVPAAIQGEAGEAIQGELKTQIANTRNQREFANGMATLLYDSANAIELEQYIVIGIGAVLLANLLIDTAVPMKAASDRIAADVAATAARRDTLTFIFQRAAAFMERFPHMALAIRATIMGAVSMGGVVAGAQYAQIVQGHGKPGRRTSMDWGQVWVAAAAGGAGGLAGSVATRAVLSTLTRTTGRGVAIMLASATGGAAGGAAGAVTMSALTNTKLTGRNLVEMVMMGMGGGLIGGLTAAMRATRAMSVVRPPENTVPDIGRSRSSGNDSLPIRPEPDRTSPHTNADTPRPHQETIPKASEPRNDSWRNSLPIRPEPDQTSPHTNADTPRPHQETIPKISEPRNDSSRDSLPIRPEPDQTPHTGGDGHIDRPSHEEMAAEIDEIGKSYDEAFSKLDEGGTPPPSDPNQPQSGTPQAPPASPTSPGSTSEASHGWSSWDDALRALTEGSFEDAPADPMAAPGSSSSTDLPGTAQFHSGRPDSPQMSLAGTVLAAEGQPSATPGSVLTMSADTHAENTPYVAPVKDLGGAGGGNGPGVTAGPPVSHGDSPTRGGPGSQPPATGKGPGQLPPDPDEAILLDLDFFDYELAPNDPVTPAGNSPTATPHAAGTTPVEPGLGSESGPTPSRTPTEAKSPTAQAEAKPGPVGATAAPAPTPVTNAPHANQQAGQANTPQPHATPQTDTPQPQATLQAAQANPPQPHATPQAAQTNPPQPHATPQTDTPQPQATPQAAQTNPPQPHANTPHHQANQQGASPQQPHAATPTSGAPANTLATQAIPPPALAGAAALAGHGPSNPDITAEHSASLPAISGAQPTNNNQTPSEPEEFPDRIGTVVTPPMPSDSPAQPQVEEFSNKEIDEYTQPFTDYKFPGQDPAHGPPHGPPPNAIPIVPHPTTPALPETGPAIPLTDRPQVPIPDTATPGAPPEDDGQKPRVHDSEPPLPRHNNTPAPHLPATPADRPTELNPPSHYALEPDPRTPGAPTDPTTPPQLDRHGIQDIPRIATEPTRAGLPSTMPAGPLPPSVGPTRPNPMMASASADKPKKPKPKRQTPQPEPPQTPTPEMAPEPPTPIPVPTPQPKKRKKNQPAAQPIREEFVVREAGEATGEVGQEGERVRAAGRTRAWVRSLGQKFPSLTEDQIDTAELLVSELVANSLRHTQGKVSVIVTETDTDEVRKIRFTVTDESEVVPESSGMPAWDAERGRGGEFVAMLSDNHGTSVQENAKSTWFELHTPPGGTSGPSIPADAPDNDYPGSDAATPPSSPEPTPTPVETDSAALSNLPNADVAARLVELVFLQSVSIEEAIDELNEEAAFEFQLDTASAQEILAQASGMLRTVFDPPDSDDQDEREPDDATASGTIASEGNGSPPGGGRPGPGIPPGPGESYVGGVDPAVLDGHVRTPRRRPSGVFGPGGLDPAVFYYDPPEGQPPSSPDRPPRQNRPESQPEQAR
ncbi:hypothetical protein ABZW16_36795, partial [Nocardia sp. NPDC004604]